MGLLPKRVGAPINDVLGEMRYAAAGLGYLEWVTYRDAAELHTQLVEPEMVTDIRMLDALTQCATRIALQLSISQGSAEGVLHRAVALRDRLPTVLDCLKQGVVSPRHIRAIVSRTELIDGQGYAPDVDAAIADAIRRRGSWSDNRMRDMVDRIVHRHDPDAVRERRARAKDDRDFWVERGEDGMAEIGATMTADNALLAFASVCDLANHVCPDDRRTQAQRRSDASFTLQTGIDWECQCGNTYCTATVVAEPPATDDQAGEFASSTSTDHRPTNDDADGESDGDGDARPSPTPPPPSGDAPAPTKAEPLRRSHCHAPSSPNRRERRAAAKHARLHAYTDPATAKSDADNSGFLDGYGVISADQIRDLLSNPGVRVHVMTNRHNEHGEVIPHPSTQPADPYQPSTALRTYIRARDQYCMWPGCNKPATATDLDHSDEYDHQNPTGGGQTTPECLIALCRFHHLIKTFSGFLTDQHIGPDGRLHTTVTTPEGLTVDGPAHTGEDLIPGLTDIEFTEPPNAPPPEPTATDEPTRRRTRLANKYAHRRQERQRNRTHREDGIAGEPEPPF